MRSGVIIFLISLLVGSKVGGQFYNTGQAPASVKWKQINTSNYQLIFPDGFYEQANRAANILELIYSESTAGYNKKPKKISVLLYNQSVLSNGYVAWAPRRMEWVTTPPQESYPQYWIEQLAIHEYRHVVQLENLEQGFTRLLKIIFGEAATGAVAGILPLWYMEGDAVLAETEYSSSGRGRSPEFDRTIRAIELDRGKRYSYDQSYLGSYKNFIPDHYRYGYQMVAFGKLKYGDNFWKKTHITVGRSPYLISPFYFGLKNQAGISKVNLYHQSFDSLKKEWINSDYLKNCSKIFSIKTDSNKFYTHYKYVQPIDDGLFAVRSGIDKITQFILIHDSIETLLHTPGMYPGSKVSVGQQYIVWEEIRPDIRWQQQSYSVLMLMDLQKGEIRHLSHKSRYFSPSLSASGDKLLCTEIDLQNKYYIVILTLPSGKIVKRIEMENFDEVSSPVWLDDTNIVFIALDSQGKRIVQTQVDEPQFQTLLSTGFRNVDRLYSVGGQLYFSFDYEMARNIYCLEMDSKEVYRVTNSRHGADFPSIDPYSNLIYYSEYTLQGYKPVYLNLDSSEWKSIQNIIPYEYSWAKELQNSTRMNMQRLELPNAQYSTTSYGRFDHSFTFHSWAPFYFDPYDFISLDPNIYPGFTIFSQNKLSTVTSSLSYYYKENTHYVAPQIKFEGLFPVFEIDALFSNEPEIFFWPSNVDLPDVMKTYYSITARSYVPLDLTRNRFYRYLQPELSYRYLNRYYYNEHGPKLGYNLAGISVYGSNLLRQSNRDIQPRFGQTIYASYHFPLQETSLFSNVLALSINQYLPGVIRHHGVRLNLSYERQDEKQIPLLNNQVSLPRGYRSDIFLYSNLKAAGEYTLPLLYPDLSIGPFVYIKRVHATLFVDYAWITYPELSNNQYVTSGDRISSAGVILSSEMHFLRFFVPFIPRMQLAYIPNEQKVSLNFYVSVNTSAF